MHDRCLEELQYCISDVLNMYAFFTNMLIQLNLKMCNELSTYASVADLEFSKGGCMERSAREARRKFCGHAHFRARETHSYGPARLENKYEKLISMEVTCQALN